MEGTLVLVLLIALGALLFGASKKGKLNPAVVEVDCPCGREVNVRIAERTHTVHCWNCNRTIEVVLYGGYGKVSVWIDNVQLHRTHYRITWQGK